MYIKLCVTSVCVCVLVCGAVFINPSNYSNYVITQQICKSFLSS